MVDIAVEGCPHVELSGRNMLQKDVSCTFDAAARIAFPGLGIVPIPVDRRIQLCIVCPWPGTVVHHDIEKVEYRFKVVEVISVSAPGSRIDGKAVGRAGERHPE